MSYYTVDLRRCFARQHTFLQNLLGQAAHALYCCVSYSSDNRVFRFILGHKLTRNDADIWQEHLRIDRAKL